MQRYFQSYPKVVKTSAVNCNNSSTRSAVQGAGTRGSAATVGLQQNRKPRRCGLYCSHFPRISRPAFQSPQPTFSAWFSFREEMTGRLVRQKPTSPCQNSSHEIQTTAYFLTEPFRAHSVHGQTSPQIGQG